MVSTGISKSQTRRTVVATALLLTLAGAFAFARSNESGAYLGVQIGDITPELASSLKLSDSSGVLVESIDHDGPACKAGMKNNDIIVSVAGTKINSAEQVVELIHAMAPGSVANFTIVREGSQQNLKVTLASRKTWAPASTPPAAAHGVAKSFMAPMPPVAFPSDVEVPLMTPASARRGIVVEALSPQLAEFFGAPNGQGVLVRNVQRGGPGANAGLKAGDVIIKIDGQEIRDLADWRRSMNLSNNKTSFSVIRDKHELVVDVVSPVPTGELRVGEDWDYPGKDMDGLNEPERVSPEFQSNPEMAMLLGSDDLDKMQRQIEKSIRKNVNKELKHQTKEIEKSMKQMQPQIRKETANIEKQTGDIQKQMEQMRPEIEKQTQAAREQMERMGPELQKQADEIAKSMAVLKQQDIEKMRRQINESMQAITPQIQEQMKLIGPQLQEQMQQLQKEMQQHQHEWQDMMKNLPASPDQPNQF